MTILYFIIGLGLLIFIHELGHFLVAKANGIRVERFSLGFGPRILKYQGKETEYCISALPLGGYVKMTGQEDFGEEEVPDVEDPRAFSSKGIWSRLSVVLAGPTMNLILPFLLMPLVFMLGRTEPKFLHQPPEVVGVLADSPAAGAGIQKGDKILSVDGSPVSNWNEVLRDTSKPAGSKIELTWEHQGATQSKTLTLKEQEKGAPGLLGVEPVHFIDVDPIIGEFMPGSPAEAAGFQSGDKVLAINGQAVTDWRQMSEIVNGSKGTALTFTVDRKGKSQDLSVTPVYNEEYHKYVIGVSKAPNPNLVEKYQYPFDVAVKKGFEENLTLFGLTFKVLGDLVTLKASYKELGGPIRIAQISAKAAERGIGNFLYLLAFLSIQLGILNLLPIPVLDGGHVVFISYEGIARRPLSMRKRLIFQQVGLFLLLTLMVLVTVNDIDAVWGFGDILAKIKGLFG
jgi:regulator of sigma E protease